MTFSILKRTFFIFLSLLPFNKFICAGEITPACQISRFPEYTINSNPSLPETPVLIKNKHAKKKKSEVVKEKGSFNAQQKQDEGSQQKSIPQLNEQFFRHIETLVPITGRSNGTEGSSLSLTNRVIESYKLALEIDTDRGESMWKIIFNAHQAPAHDVFLSGNLPQINALMQNPGCCEMFYGIDNIISSALNDYSLNPTHADGYAALCLDRLARFAEAIGAIRLFNPEQGRRIIWDADEVVDHIERTLRCTPSFPNPYPNEYGVLTSRGIAGDRAIQSLYQAYRIKQLLQGIENPCVLEIGAGVGRLAFYARMLGIEDYTIIDIPFTSTCSGYFLGRTLGEDQILLFGESAQNPEKLVKILPPSAFLECNNHYDLIINVDSLTEIDPDIAKSYFNKIESCTELFVSINHEVNPFTVNDLIRQSNRKAVVERYPYWTRKGYVEEVVQFH